MKIYWIYDYHHQTKFDTNFKKLNYLIKNTLIDFIQLRIKEQPSQTTLLWIQQCSKLIKSIHPNFPIYVNDYPNIAQKLNLTGVHIGKNDPDIQTIKKLFPKLKIGYTCHNSEDVHFAQKQNIEYLGCGTVFSSPTKTHLVAQGIDFIKQTMEQSSLMIFPIGGINKNNIEQLIAIGTKQVAISSAFFNNDFKEQAKAITNA